VGRGATRQYHTVGFFFLTQGFGLVVAVRDRARYFFAFAGTACTVLAAIGKANALAQTRHQNCFVGIGGENTTAGLHRNLKMHLWLSLNFYLRRILPSNQTPLGALPARFRRERLLIVGCGDVGLRLAKVQRHVRTFALTSQAAKKEELRRAGITPLVGNLDQATTLKRLAGLATRVVHMAPPPLHGLQDPRTLSLTRALMLRSPPTSLVYGSTSGVYGDCGGAWVTESRPTHPTTSRAQRRADAEQRLRYWSRVRGHAVRVSILRIPGIYANDRVGGTPRERLMRGTAVLQLPDDVFTNHIHANDLARACQLALWRGKAQRTYNINDDSQMRMGDYFDMAAQLYGLPTPPRISRVQAQRELTDMQMSFMRESRRLVNARMKRELRLRLLYPQVQEGLRAP